MTYTVGLVEDDFVVRENLSDFLKRRGFNVEAFEDRKSAEAAFRLKPPDIAVLDVALGDERDGGFRLCQEIRTFSKTLPVIFLTSYDEEVDRISGLRLGADDYLSKDTTFNFLAVRIETLLQRQQAMLEGEESSGPSSKLSVGPLQIDLRRAELTWQGKPVPLTLTLYWIVVELASTPSTPKTADRLMQAANINVAPNTISAHVRAIRQRFTEIDPQFDAIRTERGHGYRWVV